MAGPLLDDDLTATTRSVVESALIESDPENNHGPVTDPRDDAPLSYDLIRFVLHLRHNTDLFDPVIDSISDDTDFRVALAMEAGEYTGEYHIPIPGLDSTVTRKEFEAYAENLADSQKD